jgi:hypothetical protein
MTKIAFSAAREAAIYKDSHRERFLSWRFDFQRWLDATV